MGTGLIPRSRWRFAAVLAWLASAAPAAELDLVVQPVYPPDRAAQVYQPLVTYLNQATSHTIRLVTPRNFHRYWSDLRRRDDYDLVFDDPHLTAFKIERLGYVPMVRIAKPTVFTIIAGNNIEEETLDGLVARRVVTLPSPSMGFALLTEWFKNPLQQPNIVSSALSWEDTVEIVFADEADAAVVPLWLAERYPNLVPIHQSRQMPGAAISASPAVSETVRNEITQALLVLHEDESLYEVLVELNITRFEAASAREYAGLQELLSEVYGY